MDFKLKKTIWDIFQFQIVLSKLHSQTALDHDRKHLKAAKALVIIIPLFGLQYLLTLEGPNKVNIIRMRNGIFGTFWDDLRIRYWVVGIFCNNFCSKQYHNLHFDFWFLYNTSSYMNETFTFSQSFSEST